jgi:hypothetical protein
MSHEHKFKRDCPKNKRQSLDLFIAEKLMKGWKKILQSPEDDHAGSNGYQNISGTQGNHGS